jgi:hypothetical protein
LRQLRRIMTLREIGETIGYGDHCMSDWFRGKRAPNRAQLEALRKLTEGGTP